MPHQCTACGEVFPDGSKDMLSGCPVCGGNTFQYLPEGADPEEIPERDPPDRPEADSGVTESVGRAATTVKDYVQRRRQENQDLGNQEPELEGDEGPPSSPAESSGSPTPDESSSPVGASDSPAESSESGQASPRVGGEPEATPEDADLDDATVTPPGSDEEDGAQAAARSDPVDQSDLPEGPLSAGSHPDEDKTADAPPGEGRVVKEPDRAGPTDLETLREELNDQFESIRIIEPGQYELNLMELYDREEHIVALQEDGKYVIEVPESWREEGEPEEK
ncbi:MAG: Zn-ribbon containing protein [Halodesulfurarchaeum sp.]